MSKVTIKDKDGREVTVDCEKEPAEKCKEIADKAYEKLIEKEPKSNR